MSLKLSYNPMLVRCMRAILLTLVLLLNCSCAGPCVSHPWTLYFLYPLEVFNPSTYRGHDGSSFRNAVVLDGPKGERAAAEAESAYVTHKFNVDSLQPLQRQLDVMEFAHKTYHIIKFKTKDGKERQLYFDITSTYSRAVKASRFAVVLLFT